jgi:hypothetical protein
MAEEGKEGRERRDTMTPTQPLPATTAFIPRHHLHVNLIYLS